MEFMNRGSLITYKGADGEETSLGYLMSFPERGVYDAELGRVDISDADAKTHNRLLDAALLNGLDERCEVGQGGTFYLSGDHVSTFMGTIVADASHTHVKGKAIEFRRSGKVYRGRSQKDADCFNFRRIA